jgi:hypothetical protein
VEEGLVRKKNLSLTAQAFALEKLVAMHHD